ncbi:MAG: hypothetical protein ACREDR_27085, partial [Blastocatellia bacterium]
GDTSLKGLLVALDRCLRFKSKADMDATGALLLGLAKQARVSRRFDLLEAISNLTCNLLPDTPFARTALYYKAFCLHQNGRVSTAQARTQLETAIGLAPPNYKPGALLALAASYRDTGEIVEFAAVSHEAAKAARTVDTLSEVHALRNLAISRALLGDHTNALSMLSSSLPIMRNVATSYPSDFFSHLNSLAIEMGEVGRIDEANRLIDFVLRNPLAKHRPQWHDTKLELATKPRLVFPAFTMALGAPADARTQNDSKSLASPLELQEQAEAESQPTSTESRPNSDQLAQSGKSRSRQCKRAVAVCRCRVQDLFATPLAHRLAIQLGRSVPRPTFQPVHTDPGYAVSPPARAPPAHSQNLHTF